jgi:hypothetical protein
MPSPGRRWLCLYAAAAHIALIALCNAAYGQDKARAATSAIDVTALRNPVDKSYRKMLAGMDRFEKRRALAPAASLRFKLLPRHRDTRMEDIELQIVGDSFAIPVEVAPDHSFILPRDRNALKENASVRPNRKAATMTWRTEIRTPGLPPNTRRLGDLRLECEVGMEAGLISNNAPSLLRWLLEGPEYCSRTDPHPLYLFFADRPIFSVALVAGARREVLSVDNLYAAASRNPDWRAELPYCDCEVLVDRAYTLPLGDRSWPDDALVEFEYMDDAKDTISIGTSTKSDVTSALGQAVVIPFDSGYEVWVYREQPTDQKPPASTEFVLLFAPSGLVASAIRSAH